MRGDQLAQHRPRNNTIHLGQKRRTFGGLGVAVEAAGGKGGLFYGLNQDQLQMQRLMSQPAVAFT